MGFNSAFKGLKILTGVSEDKNSTYGFKRCTVFQLPQVHNAVTSTHIQQDRNKYKLIQTTGKLSFTLTQY